MSQDPRWDSVGPPPIALFAQVQVRALGNLANFRARRRLLRNVPRGDVGRLPCGGCLQAPGVDKDR